MIEKYMVLVANKDDLDLVVKEFDLSYYDANILASKVVDDYETVIICPHGKFDYR